MALMENACSGSSVELRLGCFKGSPLDFSALGASSFFPFCLVTLLCPDA